MEDSAPQARLYEQYLKKETFELSVVSTGVSMQEFIKKTPPDLILLDFKLPDMDGLDALNWMKKENFSCFIIVITGHSSVDIALLFLDVFANAFARLIPGDCYGWLRWRLSPGDRYGWPRWRLSCTRLLVRARLSEVVWANILLRPFSQCCRDFVWRCVLIRGSVTALVPVRGF